MKKNITWLENDSSNAQDDDELDEDFYLSPSEECLLLELFGTTLIAGSTETGKMTLVKHLIRYNMMNYHKIYLICSTANLQDEYNFLTKKGFLPVSEESINKVVKDQEQNSKQRVLLILDNCVGKLRFPKTLICLIILPRVADIIVCIKL